MIRKIFLNESEKERILSMYNVNNILNEQGDDSDVVVNIGEFKIIGETEETLEQCVDVYVEGSFPVNNTQNNAAIVASFQQKMLTALSTNEIIKKAMDNGNLTISEIKLVGGASNYYAGTTPYEMDNDRTLKTPGNGETFTASEVAIKANKNLAINRAKNLYLALQKTVFKNLKLVEDLNQPASINGYVINTGGKTDSRRDAANYPKKGQIVMVNMKICGLTIDKQQIRDCFTGLNIEVIYDRTRDDLNDPVNHKCNNATFKIYGNDISLKNVKGGEYADLNNAEGSDGWSSSYASERRGPSKKTSFTIDGLTADQFVNQENYAKYNGELSIVVECVNPNNVQNTKWGYGCHSSAALIKVMKADGTPVDQEEYIGKPPGGKNEKAELVRVNACTTDKITSTK
jgi:hypothetical protein